ERVRRFRGEERGEDDDGNEQVGPRAGPREIREQRHLDHERRRRDAEEPDHAEALHFASSIFMSTRTESTPRRSTKGCTWGRAKGPRLRETPVTRPRRRPSGTPRAGSGLVTTVAPSPAVAS